MHGRPQQEGGDDRGGGANPKEKNWGKTKAVQSKPKLELCWGGWLGWGVGGLGGTFMRGVARPCPKTALCWVVRREKPRGTSHLKTPNCQREPELIEILSCLNSQFLATNGKTIAQGKTIGT